MPKRFLRGPETGAHQHSLGTQHQRGRQASAVRDSTGRGDRDRSDRIDDRRNQRQRGPVCAVPAGLRALGDDNLGALGYRIPGIFQRLDLTDQYRSGVPDLRGVGRNVAEGQHDGPRLPFQRGVERPGPLVQRPGDKADTDRLAACLVELAPDPVGGAIAKRRVGVAGAYQAQPPGGGDCARQCAAGYAPHWSQQDRVVDVQQSGDCSPDSAGLRHSDSAVGGHYLIAMGLSGEPHPPVIGRGGAQKKNS